MRELRRWLPIGLRGHRGWRQGNRLRMDDIHNAAGGFEPVAFKLLAIVDVLHRAVVAGCGIIRDDVTRGCEAHDGEQMPSSGAEEEAGKLIRWKCNRGDQRNTGLDELLGF